MPFQLISFVFRKAKKRGEHWVIKRFRWHMRNATRNSLAPRYWCHKFSAWPLRCFDLTSLHPFYFSAPILLLSASANIARSLLEFNSLAGRIHSFYSRSTLAICTRHRYTHTACLSEVLRSVSIWETAKLSVLSLPSHRYLKCNFTNCFIPHSTAHTHTNTTGWINATDKLRGAQRKRKSTVISNTSSRAAPFHAATITLGRQRLRPRTKLFGRFKGCGDRDGEDEDKEIKRNQKQETGVILRVCLFPFRIT